MTVDRWLAWHGSIAWFLIVVNGVAGLWALAAHRLRELRGRPVWIVILAGQLSAFAMAISGVVLTARFDLVLEDFHALYGFSTIIAVGILYSYRRSPFVRDKEYLLYGVGCLFLMGLGLRNLTL